MMFPSWRWLDTGLQSGQQNMTIDEDLAREVLNGEGAPTVRVYGWQPWALSVGWNQSIDDILLERAEEHGVDVVRRPTGGRAILHARELTYSVVMPAKGRSIGGVYKEISNALVAGLRFLGIRATLETGTPDFPTLYKQESSGMCFVSSARSEIKVGTKKLVGSAQRRYAGRDGTEVVLQHGSLLLGDEHTRIVNYLRLAEDRRALVLKELRERSTDISAVLRRDVEFDEVADCLKTGFEETWNIRFQEPAPISL